MRQFEVQPFDSTAARAVAIECDAALRDARVLKIVQPDRLEIALVLRGRGRHQLLFSARGPFSRAHLSWRKLSAPPRPTGFCMLLRKHLEGGKVRRVLQPGLERILAIEVDRRDELGDPAVRTFVAELTGSHSNLILLGGEWGSGTPILASLRQVTEQMSRVRQIMPGLPYEPPPVDASRADPLAADPGEALGRAGTVAMALHAHFHSLSRHAIAQIVLLADLRPEATAAELTRSDRQRLADAWACATTSLAGGSFFPRLVVGQPWDYALLPPTVEQPARPLPATPVRPPGAAEDSAARPQGASAMLDAYYAERRESQLAETLRAHLARSCDKAAARCEARSAAARDTLARADAAEQYRHWGDLLLTWLQAVPAGASRVCLADPATGALAEVPLDPARSPADNAQRHYRAYRKALAAITIQQKLLQEAEAEAAWWGDRQADLAAAETLAELRELQALVEGDAGTTGAGKPGRADVPDRYRSADGLEILVGRNNRQNDFLTSRIARPEDWWFHAQKAPGSHVIVRAPSATAPLPEGTRQQAALLAAWHSRARADTHVPIAYTRRKHVRRKPGAAPGFVTYDHERIVLVRPDADEVGRIARIDSGSAIL